MIALFLCSLVAVAAPDRTGPPPVAPAELLELPPLDVQRLGGARVAWLPVAGVRRVLVEVVLWRGAVALDGGRSAASTITGWGWSAAAKGHPPAKLEAELALLDASISASVGDRATVVQLDVPKDALAPALDLLEAVLRHPVFPASELHRNVRDAVRRVTTESPHSPSTLASTVVAAAWYDEDDPRGGRVDLDDWAHVGRRDASKHYRRLITESPIEVLVTGDVDASTLAPRLDALLAGLGAPGEHTPVTPARPAHTGRLVAVDVPEADQAVIVVRTPAPARGDADAPAFQAIQHALGGHFLSRLNRNLREEKGLTYGAGSWWSGQEADGTWTFQVEVAERDVAVALHEIDAELDRIVASGTTPEEQAVFGTSLVGAWNTQLATSGRAAGMYADMFLHDEDVATWRSRVEALRGVRPSDTAQVAARWLGGPDRLVVVVGDRDAIAPALAPIGDATWVSAEDAAIGNVPPPR